MSVLTTPATGKLISDCWTIAEQALRAAVKNEFADRDEEMITDIFQAKLAVEVARVSASGAIARAFLSDLGRGFPRVVPNSLGQIAAGLGATVVFHPREAERKSGGDLGIVVVRPDVRMATRSTLSIRPKYRRGLLVQAKVFRRNSRWGALSKRQEQTLQKTMSYLSLLLYRYSDQRGPRRELEPFAWQLVGDANIKRKSGWLASDSFPELRDSRQVLEGILSGQVGTDNDEAITTYIAPPARSSLVVRIHWKDGEFPGDVVQVRERSTYTRQQTAMQKIRV